MEKANILVMGNSGCGKSTLINAVLGEDIAPVAMRSHGTHHMDIYESNTIPFRLIDSKGMEFGIRDHLQAQFEIDKWTKKGLEKEDSSKLKR